MLEYLLKIIERLKNVVSMQNVSGAKANKIKFKKI